MLPSKLKYAVSIGATYIVCCILLMTSQWNLIVMSQWNLVKGPSSVWQSAIMVDIASETYVLFVFH